MDKMQGIVIGCASVLLSGCFVDLERVEGLLRLTVDSDIQMAEGVQVEVGDGTEDPAYVETFFWPDSTGAARLTVPDISVLPGTVVARAQLVTETGATVDQAEVAQLSVFEDEVTAFRFDFSEGSTGSSGGTETLTASIRVSSWPTTEGVFHSVSVSLQPQLDNILAVLARHVGAPPARLQLEDDILVQLVPGGGDDADELDFGEIFADSVDIAVRAQGQETMIGTVSVSTDPTALRFPLSGPAARVDGWLTDAGDAAFILSGLAEELANPNFELRFTATLLGAP